MKRLQRYIESDRFELLGEFPIAAEQANKKVTIRLYRNRTPKQPTTAALQSLQSRQ